MKKTLATYVAALKNKLEAILMHERAVEIRGRLGTLYRKTLSPHALALKNKLEIILQHERVVVVRKRVNAFYHTPAGKLNKVKASATAAAACLLIVCAVSPSSDSSASDSLLTDSSQAGTAESYEPLMENVRKQASSGKSISVDEAINLLRRYEVIDRFAAVEIKENLFNDRLHFDDSYSDISKEIMYHYRLYRDGREKLSDYNYLGAILMLHGKKPSRMLPLECIMAFIKNGAGLEKLNGANQSPLYLAIAQGNRPVALALIAAGAQVNKQVPGYSTLLHLAAEHGQVQMVKALLSAGAQVNAACPKYKATPLLLAAEKGHTEVMRVLLAAGAETRVARVARDFTTKDGQTPLHAAAERGNEEAVKMLLAAGADSNAKRADGATPVQVACDNGHHGALCLMLAADGKAEGINMGVVVTKSEEAVRALLAKGADPNQGNPLYHAAKENKVEIARMLLEAGADPTRGEGEDQTTAMTIAIYRGHREIVSMIRATGRDKSDGAIRAAVKENDTESVVALLAAGANPNIKCIWSNAWHPLVIVAVYEGNVDIAKALLEAGADPTQSDGRIDYGVGEKTPLYIAIDRDNTNLALMMINSDVPLQISEEKSDYHLEAVELEIAIKKGNSEVAGAIIKKLVQRNITLEKGYGPIMAAMFEQKKMELIKAYLEAGASPDVLVGRNTSALTYAVETKNTEVARLLISHGAKPNGMVEPSCDTPLHMAAKGGQSEIVKLLLESGADANAAQESGGTPLLYAAEAGHQEIVKLLLDAGANVNATYTLTKATPLHKAALAGHNEVVRLLLAGGADVRAICKTSDSYDGCTPLHVAAELGNDEMVKQLLTAGADPNAKRKDGATPVQVACNNAHMASVQSLLAAKGKAKGINLEKIATEDANLTRLLIENGADVHQGNPLFTATKAGKADIVQILLDAGASPARSVEVAIGRRITPLYKAIEDKHTDIALMLIKAGSPVKNKDHMGRFVSPELEMAMRQGNVELFVALINAKAHCDSAIGSYREPFLHYMVRTQKPELIKAYLDTGVSVNGVDERKMPAIVYALNDAKAEVVKLLLDAGADPNFRMESDELLSRTPNVHSKIRDLYAHKEKRSLLHLAAFVGNVECVQALLAAGADPCYAAQEKKGKNQFVSIYPHDDADLYDVKEILEAAYKSKAKK